MKVWDHLSNSNPRQVWQGLKHLTNYKDNTPVTVSADALLAEELNHFFALFEVKQPSTVSLPPVTANPHTLILQEHRVSRVFRSRKTAWPDRVPGKVLEACANQLSAVFTKIFDLSLTHSTITSCLKSATIIPVPKKSSVSNFSDYRPITLTSVVAKCLERLISQHIRHCLPLICL